MLKGGRVVEYGLKREWVLVGILCADFGYKGWVEMLVMG
jgi:hypothetical protein